MNEKQLKNWLGNFKDAWKQRNPEKAALLFSKDVIYYENPFSKPCNNWEEVLGLWEAVPQNQKDVSFGYEIINITEKLGIVNWKVSRTKLPSNQKEFIDGIFLISLNTDGLCNFFKQWRAVKTI